MYACRPMADDKQLKEYRVPPVGLYPELVQYCIADCLVQHVQCLCQAVTFRAAWCEFASPVLLLLSSFS